AARYRRSSCDNVLVAQEGARKREEKRTGEQKLNEIVNAADREVDCCTQHHIRDREQQHRGKKDGGGQATDARGEITPAFHSPLQTANNCTGEAEGQPPAACRLSAVLVPEIFRGLGVLLGERFHQGIDRARRHTLALQLVHLRFGYLCANLAELGVLLRR